jgi:osmotically inducible lipoprotein OsmB
MRITITAATVILSSIALLGLAGCGETKGDRALSGAGLGAAAGAGVGLLTGGSLLTGAVVGGAVGAAGGALTDKDDVDLGKPAWK